MMRNLLKKLGVLRQREDGVVVVEFALWSTLFFLVVSVAMDFGTFFIQRGKINEAVTATAIATFNSSDDVAWTSLQTYVRGLTEDNSVAVTYQCNGGVSACGNGTRTCACLKTDGTYVSAAACGDPCGSGTTAGSTAGYYVTITATQGFDPLIVPRGVLDNAQIQQSATIRLE